MGMESRKHLRAAPPRDLELDRVLSEDETAEILGFSKHTLRREFAAGRAPPRVRLSAKRIGYRLSEIYKFLEAHTELPGSKRAALTVAILIQLLTCAGNIIVALPTDRPSATATHTLNPSRARASNLMRCHRTSCAPWFREVIEPGSKRAQASA